MLSFLKKLLGIKQDPKPSLDFHIPYHIEELAKLYPVVHTVPYNKSTGEIKHFSLSYNPCRVGQALILNHDREIWIHLGKDYFKNIVKL